MMIDDDDDVIGDLWYVDHDDGLDGDEDDSLGEADSVSAATGRCLEKHSMDHERRFNCQRQE